MRVMMHFDFELLSLVELREAKDELARELLAREHQLSAPMPVINPENIRFGSSLMVATIREYRRLTGCTLKDAKDKYDGKI